MGVWRNGVDALEARLAVLLGINVFREQARKPRARPLSQLSGVRTPGDSFRLTIQQLWRNWHTR